MRSCNQLSSNIVDKIKYNFSELYLHDIDKYQNILNVWERNKRNGIVNIDSLYLSNLIELEFLK